MVGPREKGEEGGVTGPLRGAILSARSMAGQWKPGAVGRGQLLAARDVPDPELEELFITDFEPSKAGQYLE